MDFTTTKAKTLFQYSTQDAIGLETALTNSVDSAKMQFKRLLGIKEFQRYTNNSATFTATSKSSTSENLSTTFYEENHILKIGDSVTLDSKIYTITMTDADYFTIDGEYTGLSLEFTINTLNDYYLIFSYCLIYQLTFTAKQLLKDDVLSDNAQYGDGAIRPVYDPVIAYRKQLLNNIETLLSVYKTLLNSSLKLTLVR